MQLLIVSLLVAYIIALYFSRNPLGHSRRFMWMRFLSWFPLGMTYGFLYMARYNLDTMATAEVITKADKSLVSGWGFFVYAASLFVTGPLIDRIGGKKGMILASLGAALSNIVMGWVVYLHLNGSSIALIPFLTVFYSINMFFQSFGAISTIKVKSFWFHVRERGTFGAIFGTLISLGVYFAFDWCDAIAKAVDVRHAGEPGAVRSLITNLFGLGGSTVSAFWLVFFIPAGFLLIWALIDLVLIKDAPDDAGFDRFETHDASAGDAANLTWTQTIKAVLTNRILLMIGVIEFTSGVLRDGTMKWYRLFVNDTHLGVTNINENWGLYAAVTGIVGSFLAGWASDRFFQSRRAPVAAIGQFAMLIAVVVITVSIFGASAGGVGLGALTIMMAVIAVHSIMSGTATADFGGRKGAATATGIADGFSKLGSSFQEFVLGAILTADTWIRWPVFLLPFTLLGLAFAWRLRRALPEATRKYLAEVEGVNV